MMDNKSSGSSIQNYEDIPSPKRSVYSIYIKRILDFLISLVALVVFSPIILVTCIVSKVKMGSPIFYKATRPGYRGEPFNMYKFRSMTNDRDEKNELLPENKRVTKYGMFLRKSSIDELPSLVSVLKGDMSIIGPRPLMMEYLPLYTKRYKMRHSVRPGLSLPRLYDERYSTWTWREQFENDIFYVENVSFLLDVKLMFCLIHEVIVPRAYRSKSNRVQFDGTNLDETRTKDEVLSENRIE